MILFELLEKIRENFRYFKESKKTLEYHFLADLGFEEPFDVDETEKKHYDHCSMYEDLVEWVKETDTYKVKIAVHNCNRDLPYHLRPVGVHVFIDSLDKNTGKTFREEMYWIDSPSDMLEHEE